MAKKKGTSRRSRHRLPIWAKILITAIVCLLVLLLVIFIVVNGVLSKISRPDLNQTYLTESELLALDQLEQTGDDLFYPSLDPSEIQWTKPSLRLGQQQELVNILLIGQDARPGETQARSDTMMLITFNKDTGDITLTSLLRDLYVQIPGYHENRLNAAYAFGGMELLDQTISENFGLQVDANVSVNFDGFSQIIDILGGVTLELSKAEAEALDLTAGINHLDGDDALRYARLRSIDDDFGRTTRQRKVITAVISSCKSASLSQINTIVDQVLPLITTDLSNMEIISYTAELFPMLRGASIRNCTIPADGTYAFHTIDGMAVIVADFDANREILKTTLEPES